MNGRTSVRSAHDALKRLIGKPFTSDNRRGVGYFGKGVHVRARSAWIAVIVLAAAGLALAVSGSAALSRTGDPASPTAADGPVPVSADTGSLASPTVRDAIRLDPAAREKLASESVDALTSEERAAYDRFVAQTTRVVRDHREDLITTAESVCDALRTGDIQRLEDLWAPDEGDARTRARAFADTYPRLIESRLQPTITVCVAGDATAYFAFAVVRWADAGITSEHTIIVPLRFIGGRWRLTSIGLQTSGLVQAHSLHLN